MGFMWTGNFDMIICTITWWWHGAVDNHAVWSTKFLLSVLFCFWDVTRRVDLMTLTYDLLHFYQVWSSYGFSFRSCDTFLVWSLFGLVTLTLTLIVWPEIVSPCRYSWSRNTSTKLNFLTLSVVEIWAQMAHTQAERDYVDRLDLLSFD